MKRLICFLLVLGFCVFPVKTAAVSTSAKSAVLINADTGEIIYKQNAFQRLPMASTTKIMTALLLCENGNMEKEITVSAEMLRVEGSSMGLLAGDTVTYEGLLYGMLLASGNDAANVTAYALGGTVDGFVKLMNKKAAELGLENTHFETPSGLDGDEHYTTAYDLALLAKYALENELFAKAAASQSAVLYYGNPPYRRSLTNHNKLLKAYPYAIGVKTGFTKKSGRCLVSAARKDGKTVIAVTLNDPNDWQDHTALLDYGLEKTVTAEIVPLKTEYSVPVVASSGESIEVKIDTFKINTLDTGGFSCQVNLPKFLYAPVKKGEVIGSAVYYKNGSEIGKTEITANRDVLKAPQKKGFFESVTEKIKLIFLKLWEI